MKTDLLLPVATAALLAMMLLGISPEPAEARQEHPTPAALHEKIQLIDFFPDFTIEYVHAFAGKQV